MDLYLVQHGESKPETEDPERPLTDQGIETVRRMASWASQVDLRVDQIRHSGKKRAEQTATLLGELLAPTNGVVSIEGLKPNDDVRPVAEALQTEQEPVMLVGHLPFLSRLTSLLVTGNPDEGIVCFQQAGIVCLGRHEGKWSIHWVMPPGLLGSFEAMGLV